jgi:hypothetical protein
MFDPNRNKWIERSLLFINNRRATWKTKKDVIKTRLIPNKENPIDKAIQASKIRDRANRETTIPKRLPRAKTTRTYLQIPTKMKMRMTSLVKAVRSPSQLND